MISGGTKFNPQPRCEICGKLKGHANHARCSVIRKQNAPKRKARGAKVLSAKNIQYLADELCK